MDTPVMDAPRATDRRAETELLLCCARTQLDAVQTERIEALLQRTLDWHYLHRKAFSYGVLPLFYKNVMAVQPAALLAAVRAPIENLLHACTAHNLFMAGELHRLLDQFELHDIPVIPFKGPVLAQSAYGDLSLRLFVDLDLLIRASDFEAVEALLATNEYRPLQHLTGLRKTLFMFLECEYPYARGRSFGIDLHTNLGPRRFAYAVDFDALWRRTERLPLVGKEVPNLAPPDLLHALCYHGAKHRWDALKYVCDVAELIRAHPSLDWDAAIRNARAQHSERMLYLGLYLVRHVLDVPLPPDVIERMGRDRQVEPLARAVTDHLLQATYTPVRYSNRLQFHLKIRDTLAAKARYFGNALFFNSMTRDWMGV